MLKKGIWVFLLLFVLAGAVAYGEGIPIEVIGINNDYPYMYVDKDGNAGGFIVDYLDSLGEEEGFDLTYKLYSPEEAGKVFEVRGDLFFASDFFAGGHTYRESVPIDIKDFHIYYNETNGKTLAKAQPFYESIETLEGVRIGIRTGQAKSTYVSKIADPDNLHIYKDYTSLLKDLDEGALDLAILPLYQTNHLISLEGYDHVKHLETPVFYQDVTFKAKESGILDQVSIHILHDKKYGKISELHKRWFEAERPEESGANSLFYFNVALAILAVMLISMVTWNGSLQKMVNERTKRLEEEVEKNKALYESVIEKEKFKNDYFMNLSHELRTPLNIILSAVQLNDTYIQQRDFDKVVENAGSYTEIIRSNSYRLLRVVNNLIDINKIETGSYPLNIDYVDIIHLSEKIIKSIYPFVNAKGIRLKLDTEYEEIFAECDPFEIERILLNLISNAIKFTDRNGKIDIKVVKNIIHKEVVISVKDTGTGIAKDNQERIFEKYTQVNTDLTRSHEGNGLGLSLVKSILDLHGGYIKLFSELGEGSEFVVHLPLKSKYQGKIDKRKDFVYQLHSEEKRVNLELADLETVDHSN